MMLTLSFKLATLTIVDGDYYRDISDNKRLRNIYYCLEVKLGIDMEDC